MPREYVLTVRQPASDGDGTELATLERVVLDEKPVQGQELRMAFVVTDVFEDEDPPRIVAEIRG
jgi:hypothetical protein